jgi:hypothetical protein
MWGLWGVWGGPNRTLLGHINSGINPTFCRQGKMKQGIMEARVVSSAAHAIVLNEMTADRDRCAALSLLCL